MKINYYRFPEGIDAHTRYLNGAEGYKGTEPCTEASNIVNDISVSEAIRLINTFGGFAWEEHCDSECSCLKITEIRPKSHMGSYMKKYQK